MKKTIGSLAVGLSLFFAQGAFADQLVTNGGFETGDFTGWTLTGPATTSSDPSAFYGVDTLDAETGTYGAYLGSELSLLTLSQTLTVLPSHTYTLSFGLAQNAAVMPGFINSFEVLIGGQTIFSEANAPVSAFTDYSFSFTTPNTTTGSDPLQFISENDLGYFSLDNVSVSTATPEPATSLLIASAISALGLVRRSKRNR